MSFCIGSYVVADLLISSIHGVRGLGFYRLRPVVAINLNPRPEDKPLTLVEVAGQVEVMRPGDPQSFSIGSLIVPKGFGSYPFPRNSPTAVPGTCRPDIEIELDQARLQAIEDLRIGLDLVIKVALRARFVDGSGAIHDSWDEQCLHVNQASWIKTLEQMGYGRRMLIELPIPDQVVNPEMAKTVEILLGAHEALRRGEWRESVGRCRDVLEALGVAMNDNDVIDPMFKPLLGNTKGMNMDARLQALRRALKVYTHPARHINELSVGYEWQRGDAITILAMISALIQKLNEPKP